MNITPNVKPIQTCTDYSRVIVWCGVLAVACVMAGFLGWMIFVR